MDAAAVDADNEARTTPIGMLRYAIDYFAAAVAADDVIGEDHGRFPPMPVYFLLGQAIELVLKAFLRQRGYKLKKLKALGHNLDKLIENAIGEGLAPDAWNQGDVAIIRLLNTLYEPREFQYIRTGTKTMLDVGPLNEVIVKLFAAIMQQVPDSHLLRSSKSATSLGSYLK